MARGACLPGTGRVGAHHLAHAWARRSAPCFRDQALSSCFPRSFHTVLSVFGLTTDR